MEIEMASLVVLDGLAKSFDIACKKCICITFMYHDSLTAKLIFQILLLDTLLLYFFH